MNLSLSVRQGFREVLVQLDAPETLSASDHTDRILNTKRAVEQAVDDAFAALIVEAPPIIGAAPRSTHWPSVRAAHLKDNPVCIACGTDKFPEVHHCKPFHLHPELELDPSNLVTLCEAPGRNCHYCFGHAYDWHSYNPHVREDAALFLKRVQGAARLRDSAGEQVEGAIELRPENLS